jgi:hypothetical protein
VSGRANRRRRRQATLAEATCNGVAENCHMTYSRTGRDEIKSCDSKSFGFSELKMCLNFRPVSGLPREHHEVSKYLGFVFSGIAMDNSFSGTGNYDRISRSDDRWGISIRPADEERRGTGGG